RGGARLRSCRRLGGETRAPFGPSPPPALTPPTFAPPPNRPPDPPPPTPPPPAVPNALPAEPCKLSSSRAIESRWNALRDLPPQSHFLRNCRTWPPGHWRTCWSRLFAARWYKKGPSTSREAATPCLALDLRRAGSIMAPHRGRRERPCRHISVRGSSGACRGRGSVAGSPATSMRAHEEQGRSPGHRTSALSVRRVAVIDGAVLLTFLALGVLFQLGSSG